VSHFACFQFILPYCTSTVRGEVLRAAARPKKKGLLCQGGGGRGAYLLRSFIIAIIAYEKLGHFFEQLFHPLLHGLPDFLGGCGGLLFCFGSQPVFPPFSYPRMCPSIAQSAKQHPWFSGLDWDGVLAKTVRPMADAQGRPQRFQCRPSPPPPQGGLLRVGGEGF